MYVVLLILEVFEGNRKTSLMFEAGLDWIGF
jgi:hypothetical protein